MPETVIDWNNPAYSKIVLTEMVNNIDYIPQQIAQDGLFVERPVPSWNVAMDILERSIQRPGTRSPYGGEPNVVEMAKATLKSLSVYHVPFVDMVTPADVQDIRLPGEAGVASVLSVIGRKQADIVASIDLAHEWFRMGAIQGKICEPGDNTKTLANATVLLNLQTEFGKSISTVDMDTDTAGTDQRGKCTEVLRKIEEKLAGRAYTDVICYLDSLGWDAFIAHSTVLPAYTAAYAINPALDLRKGFRFAGILFKEYRQRQISAVNEMIPANTGYFVATGTGQFRSYYGPARYFATANQNGTKFYSKQVPAADDASTQLQVQSNPLIINTNPDAVVCGTFTSP